MLPGQLALWQMGKVVCVCTSQRAVASAARPVGTVAGGQSGRPRLLWLVNSRSILLGRLYLLALPCLSGSMTGCKFRYCCGSVVMGLFELRPASRARNREVCVLAAAWPNYCAQVAL